MLAAFFCIGATSTAWKGPFLCEWEVSPAAVHDSRPVFSWKFEGQTSYRLLVSDSYDGLKEGRGKMFDSGKVSSSLNAVEYVGVPLASKHTYYWRVKVWGKDLLEQASSPIQRFTTKFSELPRRQGHIRTFVNFGQQDSFISKHYDLTFRSKPKKLRPSIVSLNYVLLATMVIPSEQAELLEKFSQEKGLVKSGIPEDFFLHLQEDENITLHVGQERSENPVQTRRVLGWDPTNDKNGDGVIDDEEYANRLNTRANARKKSESRVPIYYWGPPKFDYVMNIAHPLYKEFLATTCIPSSLKGFDGAFIDTLTRHVPGPGRQSKILEIPDDNAWMRSIQTILTRIKQSTGRKYIIGNGWVSDPFVIDGMQSEEWLNISKNVYDVESALQLATFLDQRGKIQLLQYNPSQGLKQHLRTSGIAATREKDLLYGLALYYLVQGKHTYFGCGRHPYDKPENEWFPAMEYNIGVPKESYNVIYSAEQDLPANNLLKNASFETRRNDGKLKDWIQTENLVSASEKKISGNSSIKIVSTSAKANNINSQHVVLEPYTFYTVGGFISTENLDGPGGAQIYPYGDDIEYIDKTHTFFHGTNPWRFCSFVFKTGKSGKARINFRIKEAKGTAWFDDIFLVKGSYPNHKVFSREYEKGLVVVRVTTDSSVSVYVKPTTIDLKGEYRPLHLDGSVGNPIRRISLGNNEACILVRSR